MPTAAQTTDPPPQRQPRHALGVLFVHGIGTQPRGDTLVRFGEPVVAWLSRWLMPLGQHWALALGDDRRADAWLQQAGNRVAARAEDGLAQLELVTALYQLAHHPEALALSSAQARDFVARLGSDTLAGRATLRDANLTPGDQAPPNAVLDLSLLNQQGEVRAFQIQ